MQALCSLSKLMLKELCIAYHKHFKLYDNNYTLTDDVSFVAIQCQHILYVARTAFLKPSQCWATKVVCRYYSQCAIKIFRLSINLKCYSRFLKWHYIFSTKTLLPHHFFFKSLIIGCKIASIPYNDKSFVLTIAKIVDKIQLWSMFWGYGYFPK